MKPDDLLWKAILEDVFDDFLLFFFGEEAKLFDFERGFEFLDKELEQLFPPDENSNSPKFVDKLVKVFTKTGKEEWMLVHVEVQGYNDPDFEKRMFKYFYRIYDKHDKPITCIAIFTDGNKNYKPAEFNYNFLGTKAVFSYNTYKISDQNEAELRKSNNPFAAVVLVALLALQKGKITEDTLYEYKMALAKMLLQKRIPKTKISAIRVFLRNYVRFDNAEIVAKFDAELDVLTNKRTTMGIEEFIIQRVRDESEAIGVGKGMEIATQKINFDLTKKFLLQTDFSYERIADMVGVSVEFVEDVRKSLNTTTK